jgi:nitrite reductase (cytochrome c-552)
VPLWALIVIVLVAAGITFAITAIIMNISDRKAEGTTASYREVVALTATTYDPAVWGQNFPMQYDGWKATADFTATNHNQALVEHTPSETDPRTQTTASKLEEDPRLVTMWKGYAFAVDYRHLRGHAYMQEDQKYTLRVQPPRQQPGACLNCHVSTPEVYAKLGNGDQMAGFDAMNKLPYAEAAALATGPVGCIDCHDPETMELRITRPALINGLKALKASQGIADYDVNRDASTQEMRSYVCAQCHVEYYFAGDGKTLTFPWAKGTDIDDVWEYYGEIGFTDFTNELSGAKVVKAQHPEFESWSAGVHAANGVTCADCHMNYERVGSQKVSNHDVTTPMADINGTCGTCHTASEQVLKDEVTTIQNRFTVTRDRALDALTQLITAIQTAQTDGTPAAQIEAAQKYQNMASFYVDYGYSENSYGFHAPDYFQRLFTESLDASRKGQLVLLGVPEDQLAVSDVAQNHLDQAKESGLK